MKYLLSLSLSWFLLAVCANADTVELFLLESQDGEIQNLNLAREQGHQLVYYYLDAELAIEDKLNKEVEAPLDKIFQSVISSLSDSELKALGDEGITDKVMLLISEDEGFQQQMEIMKSVSNDPDITAALARAEEDKQLAAKRGIEMDELPAIYFNGKKYVNVTDFHSVSDGEAQ